VSLSNRTVACAPVICVAMAVHNGARFLPEQLDSLHKQSLKPVHLLVGDDRSTDETADVISSFMEGWQTCNFSMWAGPCRGYSANFNALFAHVPENTDYLALSDQDDVWLADKLERAVRRIEELEHQNKPVLYGSASLICDENLSNPRPSVRAGQPLGFGHAIAQNFAGGNTMVMNRAAIALIRSAAPWHLDIPVHDWWLYQLISGAGGEIIYDTKPGLYYRQHDLNMIGVNDTLVASLYRIKDMLSGVYLDWNNRNVASLIQCGTLLTPENRQLVLDMEQLGTCSMADRLRFLRHHRIRRRGISGTCGLWLSAVLNKF